ncbi:hypothetical protein HC891_23935 [Candidatus Gracilibacteria bacterium]|nr:hypothetical protein [Candidatus Gracilibacteria bacterium]
METLRYTLVADGSSDRALIPIITWALRQQSIMVALQAEWADLSRLPRRPQRLDERIAEALNLYPCELLCIHRDAERELPDHRRTEINAALVAVAKKRDQMPPALCMIPVRIQEAWLLFDEAAIRAAAGNPNGKIALDLPQVARVERLPDPKETLRQLLRLASGLNGHRLQQFDDRPQRVLPAFAAFEAELRDLAVAQGWNKVVNEE